MKKRVVVLGAGFGGLELCTTLSEALDDAVRLPYRDIVKRSRKEHFGSSRRARWFGRQS